MNTSKASTVVLSADSATMSEDIATARKEMYEDIVNGLTRDLEQLKEYIAQGKHRHIACACAALAQNGDQSASMLAQVITLEAVSAYTKAGGRVPTTRQESLDLANTLFPRDMSEVDPAVVARANPRTDADKAAERKVSSTAN